MYYKIVLILLIIINILNTVLNRDGHSGDRTVIYVFNGITIIFAACYCVMHSTKYPKYFKCLNIFVAIIILDILLQFTVINNSYFMLGQYIRMLMSIILIYFFYKYKPSLKLETYFRLYVVTYIFQCCLKILAGQWFQNANDFDDLRGGDTVAIGLATVIPLIFIYFKEKWGFILFLISFIFICFSLRRTALLAVIIVIPFIWTSIKPYVKLRSIMVMLPILVGGVFIAWERVGAQLVLRFTELFEGDRSGGSYGSGRSTYWTQIFEDYLEQGNILFGNGMGSVYEFYSKIDPYVSLPHAHSDIFEILYTFGLVGLISWGLFIGRSLKFAIMSSYSKDRQLLLCTIVLYIFIGASSGILLRTEMFPFSIALAILINRIKTNKQWILQN